MKMSQIVALPLLLSLVPIACGDGEPDTPPYECSDEVYEEEGMGGAVGGAPPSSCESPSAPKEEIEIAGNYTDDFGGIHNITPVKWGTINFSYVDNEENYAVGRNDEDAVWDACSWSLVFWHEEEGNLYYCQAAFSAESECAAMNSAMPDFSDLTAGCSGFPWSQLIAN